MRKTHTHTHTAEVLFSSLARLSWSRFKATRARVHFKVGLGVKGEVSQQVCSCFGFPPQFPCKWEEPARKLIIRRRRLPCRARPARSRKTRPSSCRPPLCVFMFSRLLKHLFFQVFGLSLLPLLSQPLHLHSLRSRPASSLDNRSLPPAHNICKAVYAPGIF